MSVQKPSLPRGTRDFGPEKMIKRTFIFDTIKGVFKKFGFLPLETPSMENLSVLTGKYGDEGDQLIFKILNSGNYLDGVEDIVIHDGFKKLTPKIAEKALRYDLTVPFARFVVMNRNDIQFPFRRYQMQPVWRADRPQKGRYREFYQCDADVVGTNSLLCEAEIVSLILEVFSLLGIQDYSIKINNRKILQGIVEAINKQGEETTLCVAIDKLDKIGKSGVTDELLQKGFTGEDINKLMPIFELAGDTTHVLDSLGSFLGQNSIGLSGISEIKAIYQMLETMGVDSSRLSLDLSLARGLSYYTGAIFEVKVHNVQIGSVSGGGRYDNLTGIFGLPGISGVGISFGVDRLYDVMEELNLFPNQNHNSTKVLITYLEEEGFKFGLQILNALRAAGVNSELYPDLVKIKKQFEYAGKKNIPFVVIIGAEELAENKVSVKDMESGNQVRCSLEELVHKLLEI